jgi:hypothetical protein
MKEGQPITPCLRVVHGTWMTRILSLSPSPSLVSFMSPVHRAAMAMQPHRLRCIAGSIPTAGHSESRSPSHGRVAKGAEWPKGSFVIDGIGHSIDATRPPSHGLRVTVSESRSPSHGLRVMVEWPKGVYRCHSTHLWMAALPWSLPLRVTLTASPCSALIRPAQRGLLQVLRNSQAIT